MGSRSCVVGEWVMVSGEDEPSMVFGETTETFSRNVTDLRFDVMMCMCLREFRDFF